MAWSEATQPPPTDETRRVHVPKNGQDLGRRQCIGTRFDGERCQKPPIRGGTVCTIHGGATPLARHAAQRVLLQMVEPAVETLFNALEATDADGVPVWPSRVAAARALLDRAGFGPSAKLIIDKSQDDTLSNLDKNALAQELESLSRQLRGEPKEFIDVTPTAPTAEESPNVGIARMNDADSRMNDAIHSAS